MTMAIPNNRWDLLPVLDLDSWKPSEQVTVVVPAYQCQSDLDRTLAGLRRQSYPRDLLEVVVVDDGSDPPLSVASDVTLIRLPRAGFGLARARNAGAEGARGSTLIFLDADMVPERQFVAAHARWHSVSPIAVSLGFRHHTDLGDLSPSDVGTLVESDGLRAVALQADLGRPEWLEAHFRRTVDATDDAADLFRLLTGGNFAVSASNYSELGGTSEAFTAYGGEDREFGWRAFVDGLLFVPDRRAFAWHQGPGGWQAPDIEARKAAANESLANFVADTSFRAWGATSTSVPMFSIEVGPGSRRKRQVTLTSVEQCAFGDLSHETRPFVPYRVWLSAGTMLGPAFFENAYELVRNPQVGRISVVSGSGILARIDLTRAVRRAERLGLPPEAAFDMFGQRTVKASDIGLFPSKVWSVLPRQR